MLRRSNCWRAGCAVLALLWTGVSEAQSQRRLSGHIVPDCAAPVVAAPNCAPLGLSRPAPVTNRVYVFRGAAGWYPGVDSMGERLRQHGYDPVIRFSWQMHLTMNQMLRRRECGAEAGPLRIVAYSMGTHAACEMCRELQRIGMPVDRLVLLECFTYPTIPGNVRYCFNLYESRPSDNWFIFRGTPVTCESRGTRLVSIDVTHDPQWAMVRECNHFYVCENAIVQETMCRQLQMR